MAELMPVDLLIEGGSIITMDPARRIVRDGAIAVTGDRIVAVGKRDALRARYRGARVLDAGRHVITPGLVNSHVHFYHQMHRNPRLVFPAYGRDGRSATTPMAKSSAQGAASARCPSPTRAAQMGSSPRPLR